MERLARHYPIEWGVLIDEQPRTSTLFPPLEVVHSMLAGSTMRWAAHVCGALATRIASGEEKSPNELLRKFRRLQINHGFGGSTAEQARHCSEYAHLMGSRAVLQCQGEFPQDSQVDWLYDVSFGRGSRPTSWPSLPHSEALCGFSGGINADNVRDVLRAIAAAPGSTYWIDMESGVRTDDLLDLGKCEAVCRAVFD
jgi:hypothetical protein